MDESYHVFFYFKINRFMARILLIRPKYKTINYQSKKNNYFIEDEMEGKKTTYWQVTLAATTLKKPDPHPQWDK